MAIERDFRKLARARQAELRRVAVEMVAAGKTRIEAAAAVGVNRRFVGEWVKTAAQSGEPALADEGYIVDAVASSDRKIIDQVAVWNYDAIILDIKRPGDAVRSPLQSWRQAGLKTPVLVLTPPPSFEDQIRGIHLSVNTWMTQAFQREEMLIRLRALAPDARGGSYIEENLARMAVVSYGCAQRVHHKDNQ